MKKTLLTVGAFFVSIILFISIFQLVNPIKKEANSNNKDFNLTKEHNYTAPCISQCQDKYQNIATNSHQKCISACNNQETYEDSILNNIAMYTYLTSENNATKIDVKAKTSSSPDFVIKSIYFLIWLALWVQTSLLFFSLFCKNLGLLKPYSFHIVDAALSSPPILGVMGTIYSFAIYTTKLDSTSDLIAGFKSSFFDAAFTTIIAGFIYIVNLYFKIIILRDEDEDEKEKDKK